MVKMSQLVDLVDDTIERLAAEYANLPPALLNADPKVLRAALRQAGGDPRRVTAEDDGGIIVWNRRVW